MAKDCILRSGFFGHEIRYNLSRYFCRGGKPNPTINRVFDGLEIRIFGFGYAVR